ncbi:hypothetical protein [Candidatus Methylobacter favarea]|nr:hypothetical protein [Candidatus Methylobacter favarea]
MPTLELAKEATITGAPAFKVFIFNPLFALVRMPSDGPLHSF